MVMVGLVAQKCFRRRCVGVAALIVVLIVISTIFRAIYRTSSSSAIFVRGQMATRGGYRVHRSVDPISTQSIVMVREALFDFDGGGTQRSSSSAPTGSSPSSGSIQACSVQPSGNAHL